MSALESTTLLLDPTSHNSNRTFFTIPAGLKYFTRKLRLLNFRVLNPAGSPIYFGTNGVYSLIRNITVANLQGVVIDQLSSMDVQGFRNIHAENSTSQYLGRQLLQNQCVSVSCPSMSQVCLTETAGRDSASQIYAHIDISSMLNYLQARAVADEGLQITIEWVSYLGSNPVNGNFIFDTPPCLAVDEVLSALPVDKQDVFIYSSIIPNRLYVNYAGPGSLAVLETRLNSYIQCYISNIYYFMATSQNGRNTPEGTFNPANYDWNAVQNERLELTVDGKWLMVQKGINSDARKLQMATDWSGDFCIPTAVSYYQGIQNVDGGDYGLINLNTGALMNGNLSMGVVAVNSFIKDNLSVSYQGTLANDIGTPGNIQQLFFLAEVLRSYSKKTGTVANVLAPQASPSATGS